MHPKHNPRTARHPPNSHPIAPPPPPRVLPPFKKQHCAGQSLGVRRPVAFMTSSKFRPPSPPDAPVNPDFDLKEGEDDEEGSGDAAAAAAEEVRGRQERLG